MIDSDCYHSTEFLIDLLHGTLPSLQDRQVFKEEIAIVSLYFEYGTLFC